jgi:hypothetical protein
MFRVDYTLVHWDVSLFRWQARKAVELGTKLGVENKSDAEVRKEADELVMKTLLTVINRIDVGYEMRSTDTPESLYVQLWRICYEYERMYTARTDIEYGARELLRKELGKVFEILSSEYDRRLNWLANITNDVEA